MVVRTVWINVKGQLRGQGHVWWSLEVSSELESELKYDSDSSDAAPRYVNHADDVAPPLVRNLHLISIQPGETLK